jgi:hypothetical protein
MRIDQLMSDYLTLSREQSWKLVKKLPKLALKHLISVLKPVQLKELCKKDLSLEYIELRKDFPSFIKHVRAREAVAELLLAQSRTVQDANSSDKTSTGSSTKSYSSGSHLGSRASTAKDRTSNTSKGKALKCHNDTACNKHGKTDYHYMTDCPRNSKEGLWRCWPIFAQLGRRKKLSRRSSPPRMSGASYSRPRTPRLPRCTRGRQVGRKDYHRCAGYRRYLISGHEAICDYATG